MNQEERRLFLIRKLLAERREFQNLEIPENQTERKRLLRSLLNIRMPLPADEEFLAVQDAYLKEEIKQKGITSLADLRPVQKGIYLWQGDITTLACDAIVNAANSQMLGCFCPCHGCIDNAIHTFSGIQLRSECAALMEKQGHEEPAGSAKITSAYNLPSRCVIHTVGPIVHGRLTLKDRKLLALCYRSCLELAQKNKVKSIAFCCISTGEFHFPNEEAARIAVSTTKEFLKETQTDMEVVFNVFKDEDYKIYKRLLTGR